MFGHRDENDQPKSFASSLLSISGGFYAGAKTLK